MMTVFVAKRLKGSGLSLPQVLPNLAQLLSKWKSTPPLCYAGWPPIQIELTESGIANYMEWLKQINDIGIPKTFSLSSHDYKPQLSLTIGIGKFTNIESLKFPIYSDSANKTLQLDRFIDLITQLCLNFSAYHGYIFDYRVYTLLYLQTILHPSKYDGCFVPYGVWWINFWDSVQVKIVGIEKIRSAPWERLVELSNGSMVLVATESPIDAENNSHLARLDEICQHLHLRELQEQYLLSKLSLDLPF